ncbi:hypothetical protein DNU06_15860 [Putridiphycobacter roseus]|uniref:Beta-lactamase-inhibitor-like PepSY-like domain-containing protein n=1 Tax=Putridiphycobacter roseus TaxID=2219161 RepID=A0A2W1N9C3_9FLAO|nr:hypothetical protein [Putridiphycobacter roseus]PZE15855.1 hypothetical protein DNU06_15860 [Putridiphycobacter roseus]
MKKVILTGAIAFGLMGTSFAQNTTEVESTSIEEVSEAVIEIELSELPEAVQATLKSEKYAEYQAQKAWLIEQEEGGKMYKVVVLKEEEVKTLLFNDKGEVVIA